MGSEFLKSLKAVLIFTIILGLGYPLVITGISQLAFSNAADGSLIERDGEIVGSELVGQGFGKNPEYFQSRPSVTSYSGSATFFENLGPNQKALYRATRNRVERYLELEGPFNPGLDAGSVPVDAVTASASGIDPHISVENAEIQANRVAEERGLELQEVLDLIDENTDDRGLLFAGNPGVNVLELNLALDEKEAG